jgi:uncharacterized protein
MDQHVLLYILAAILIVVGVLGVILPALPGLPLVFGGMLLAAWTDGFERIGVWTLVILGVLTLLSLLIDIVGVFIAPFVGAVIGELLHRRKLAGSDVGHATKVGLGTWFGIMVGVVSKLALAFAMIGLFFFAWYF